MTHDMSPDAVAQPGQDEPREYTAVGGDWAAIAEEAVSLGEERMEIDGETVTEARCAVGYLHTGIEKTMEVRSWTQGVTFCTRMDYLAPFSQEVAYCLAVEKLLGITAEVSDRASVIRVMLMELNRIASHMVALATGGLEIGALTVMTIGFREREKVLKIFELVTGLRMNHAFVRPGGLVQDIPPGTVDAVRAAIPSLRRGISDIEKLSNENPLVKARLVDVGYLDLTGCMALGITGPILRSTGLPHDVRVTDPYCGYETYDFEVQTWDSCDAYGRMRIRINEMKESLRIVEQCADRLERSVGPVMIADAKIASPSRLAIGADGMGNSLGHIEEIMGSSMESLIHHFKLVTEGYRVPAGQVYVPVEAPRGELAAHIVSDGGTRPYRAHFRDPSFHNLQAVAALAEGGQVADLVVAVASIDPVLGGVDR
jgi:NADH-quinone oxidoreductase subunit D